jgi:hypothetical protein
MSQKFSIDIEGCEHRAGLEIGSEFEWSGVRRGPFLVWPEPGIWFSSGRDALLALWCMLKSEQSNCTLLIPDYFCPEVEAYWVNRGIAIRHYVDNPQLPGPDWKTINPSPSDVVMAVNYFGIRDSGVWRKWHEEHSEIVLIEDHTHNPFSEWAKSSTAHYCFASIRKTFPIPDGAILWSPHAAVLPSEPVNSDWQGSSFKLAAMILKREYIDSQSVNQDIKKVYRNLQIEGEQRLSLSENNAISPWSRAILQAGFPQEWLRQREDNIYMLLNLIGGCTHLKPLFTKWPEGSCPYNVVILFQSEEVREFFRLKMISNGIFTSVHWSLEPERDAQSLDLSKRILTIPVDHRYGEKDICHIATFMKRLDASV